jgi:predicted nucleic acid-binding protein
VSLVVVDASPLNYLLLLQREILLPRIFNEVIIPEAVLEELKHRSAPRIVRDWALTLPDWITTRRAERLLTASNLDLGELEAISIALELSATVLLDEKKGRAFARAKGLDVIGTIGVLEYASDRGWLVIEEEIRKLEATNIRLATSLIEEALGRRPRHDEDGRNAS